MKEKATEWMPNEYGIMVKKCCASCAHKYLDDFGNRRCMLTGRPTRGCCVCKDWEISSQLATLGEEHGKVQCREYQLTLMEVRISELRTKAMGNEMTPASVESIRRDFELKHGSRIVIK
jgi:hypothetical protein